ncbi:MAG: transglutaminase domain-containing protein [Deltaproteobacteria bacterium]|nr:transglutaminase domain-containing protein [Deltaproteobacteria bacterium]
MRTRPPPVAPRRRPLLSLFRLILSSLWLGLVVVAPLTAAWVASSLAAHAGASTRLALASALLVFPVVPLLWEAFAAWRRSRRPATRRFLTLSDRLVLRTLAVSFVFVGALLARNPQRAFEALNGRGDWMLDGRHDRRAETARRTLFRVAAKSAWLYHLADAPPPRPQPLPEREVARVTPTPSGTGPTPSGTGPTPSSTGPTPSVDEPAPVLPPPPRDPHAWPWPADELHAAVLALTPADETSPAAVGRFLAAHEHDQWHLARAVHDYVADRIAYDVASYRAHRYPPQDAETTFRTRLSVCAGYAALFRAVGRAAGLTVEVVRGRARHAVTDGMGEGHAWNAVKLDDRWYLVDTTWDAGGVDDEGFHKHYGTSYFLTPPEVFLSKHYPDEDRWQLLPVARTPGEFLRMPPLRPQFFGYGLRLVSPDRAESDARAFVDVVIDNPRNVWMMVSVRTDGGEEARCEVSRGTSTTARCPLNGRDLHEVVFFASNQQYGSYEGVGSLSVHNR